MIALITGDREWKSKIVILKALETLPEGTVIIHGYARGADSIADEVAKKLGFKTVRCPAHWSHNDKKWIEVYGECDSTCRQVVGRAAGVIRNKWMADTYCPDRIMAFHNDIRNSRGTRNMVEYGERLGIPHKLFTDNTAHPLAEIFKKLVTS